jgi:hypothetical protein
LTNWVVILRATSKTKQERFTVTSIFRTWLENRSDARYGQLDWGFEGLRHFLSGGMSKEKKDFAARYRNFATVAGSTGSEEQQAVRIADSEATGITKRGIRV